MWEAIRDEAEEVEVFRLRQLLRFGDCPGEVDP